VLGNYLTGLLLHQLVIPDPHLDPTAKIVSLLESLPPDAMAEKGAWMLSDTTFYDLREPWLYSPKWTPSPADRRRERPHGGGQYEAVETHALLSQG